jgi:hypothetical protein
MEFPVYILDVCEVNEREELAEVVLPQEIEN